MTKRFRSNESQVIPATISGGHSSVCGSVLQFHSPSKLTCIQETQSYWCKKCRSKPANPGYSWCERCYTDNKCPKIGVSCSPGKKRTWYQSHLENKEGAQTPLSPELCPVCNKPRFLDAEEKKMLHFCGRTCANIHYARNGALSLDPNNEDFIRIALVFKEKWNPKKGICPMIKGILKVRPNGVSDTFRKYVSSLSGSVNPIEYYFHGCKITCDLLKSKSLCGSADCTICQVSRQGFDISKVGTNVKFTRFGKCLYFAPESSKCHDYTRGDEKYGYRAMFYVKCAPGFKQISYVNDENRTAPDKGYNSIYGHAGKDLNYDELCLFDDRACVPDYVIIYEKDGVNRRCF